MTEPGRSVLMNNVFEEFKTSFKFSHCGKERLCALQLGILLLLLGCFQPTFATPTTPTSDFINNGNGTVTHKTTGLTWMRCALGQTWTGTSCSGTAATYTYDEAIALKRSFAGHSDWRLPNIAELQTIGERESTCPAINTVMFPNTPTDSCSWQSGFWSASNYVSHTAYAWTVSSSSGSGYVDVKQGKYYVRLVRSGQSFDSLPLTTPTSDFIDNKNGTVTHKRTGLIWQRCAVGQIWTGSTCSGTVSYYPYAQAIALKISFSGHSDWRTPNIYELVSIVDRGSPSSSFNPVLFPNAPVFIWSSSGDSNPYGNAWWLSYATEALRYKGASAAVRLVRGGQSSISSPFSIFQSPLSGSPGKVFVQWGNGFSPNSSATLHVKKPDGTEYPTQQQAVDAKGHFAINYTIPADKPAGTYSWWAVDGKTGKKSAVITYTITPLTNVAKLYGKLHINAANGPALVGATVSVGSKITTTIGDGSFSLANIATGQQEVHFAKTGYQSFSTTIIIPGTGSKDMGNRWLVQNGVVKPTIAQAPLVGLPGTTFTQWGTGFTPNGLATLHFKKPDGTEYPTVTTSSDNVGNLTTTYRTPMDKPAGVYSWWAVDSATYKASNVVVYTVSQPVNPCQAPTELDALLKTTAANCRDKWNLVIFYKELLNGYIDISQRLLQSSINGTLDDNKKIAIAIDGVSSIISIATIPELKGKNIDALFGVGANSSIGLLAKFFDNEYAQIWIGLVGAGVESFKTGSFLPLVLESFPKIGNNLLTTISVTTKTKRFQELEIAKQFLFRYYSYGSQMDLVAKSYGLTANARIVDIINVIGNQIGAKNPWYWFNDYDVSNVLDHIKTIMEIVGMKEVAYSK
jgi:Protein of unknown function (DUF1566)